MQIFNYRRVFFLIKLLSPFVVASLICAAGLIVLLYITGGRMLEEQLRKRVLDEFTFLEYEFREDGAVELLEEIEERLEKAQQSWRFLYAVESPEGEQVFDTLLTRPDLGWSRIQGLDYAESSLLLSRELGDGYRLSVGLAENDLYAYRHTFFTSAGWLFFASAVASILLGLFMYRRFIAIVRILGLPMQQFSDGNFDVRIPKLNAGPDLDNLTKNVNAMFDQIERLVKKLKTVTANIAHDLRTPLTRVNHQITLASESASEETRIHLFKAEEELKEVLRLFREILQLNEIQSGRLQIHFTAVNLTALISESIELYQPLLEEHNITHKINLSKNIMLMGSVQLLKQVVVNLIENTLSHSSGDCDMYFDLTLVNNNIQFSVRDNGKPSTKKITKDHFGLGLNFIHAIVELHGGSVSFSENQNSGFCCDITLPTH